MSDTIASRGIRCVGSRDAHGRSLNGRTSNRGTFALTTECRFEDDVVEGDDGGRWRVNGLEDDLKGLGDGRQLDGTEDPLLAERRGDTVVASGTRF